MHYVNSVLSARKNGLQWCWHIIFTGKTSLNFKKKSSVIPSLNKVIAKLFINLWHDSPTNIYFIFHRINWQWHLILLTVDSCPDLWNCLTVNAEKTKVHRYSIERPGKHTSLESQMEWKGFRTTIFPQSPGYFITSSEQFIILYCFR